MFRSIRAAAPMVALPLRMRLGLGASAMRFSTSAPRPAKVVCVLYEGGAAGKKNPNILGCVENELGLRKFLEGRGHTVNTAPHTLGRPLPHLLTCRRVPCCAAPCR
jgi:hypothetical protein